MSRPVGTSSGSASAGNVVSPVFRLGGHSSGAERFFRSLVGFSSAASSRDTDESAIVLSSCGSGAAWIPDWLAAASSSATFTVFKRVLSSGSAFRSAFLSWAISTVSSTVRSVDGVRLSFLRSIVSGTGLPPLSVSPGFSGPRRSSEFHVCRSRITWAALE